MGRRHLADLTVGVMQAAASGVTAAMADTGRRAVGGCRPASQYETVVALRRVHTGAVDYGKNGT